MTEHFADAEPVTFEAAISAFFRHFFFSLRLVLPWAVLMAAVSAALYSILPKLKLAADSQNAEALLALATMPIGLLASASIAVNWHHKIVLHDKPKGFLTMRLDGPVWRYLGLLLVYVIVAGLLIGGAIYGVAHMHAQQAVPAIAGIALYVAFYVGLRLSPKLIAVAVGGGRLSLREAWRHSQPRAGGIFFGIFLLMFTSSLFALPFVGLAFWLKAGPNAVYAPLAQAAGAAFANYIWGFVMLSFMAMIYKLGLAAKPPAQTTA